MPFGIDKFCCLQAIENGNREYYVWVRKGNVGKSGSSKVLGNGLQWGIYKWFLSTFKELPGISWRDRLKKPPVPGQYEFLRDGARSLTKSALQSDVGVKYEKQVKVEVDLTQREVQNEPPMGGKMEVGGITDLEAGGNDDFEAQMP